MLDATPFEAHCVQKNVSTFDALLLHQCNSISKLLPIDVDIPRLKAVLHDAVDAIGSAVVGCAAYRCGESHPRCLLRLYRRIQSAESGDGRAVSIAIIDSEFYSKPAADSSEEKVENTPCISVRRRGAALRQAHNSDTTTLQRRTGAAVCHLVIDPSPGCPVLYPASATSTATSRQYSLTTRTSVAL